MKGILLGLGAVAAALVLAASSAAAWSDPVGTNVVVSSPVAGGGYPVPPGGTKPVPGTCGPQQLNSNHSDPNVDFDTHGRAYMTTLPFNAYWDGGLHPNGEIDVSYSDDLGRTWRKANDGQALDSTNNQNSVTLGHVEDKQWIAVNHIP